MNQAAFIPSVQRSDSRRLAPVLRTAIFWPLSLSLVSKEKHLFKSALLNEGIENIGGHSFTGLPWLVHDLIAHNTIENCPDSRSHYVSCIVRKDLASLLPISIDGPLFTVIRL